VTWRFGEQSILDDRGNAEIFDLGELLPEIGVKVVKGVSLSKKLIDNFKI